jgi:hypothetical protein
MTIQLLICEVIKSLKQSFRAVFQIGHAFARERLAGTRRVSSHARAVFQSR